MKKTILDTEQMIAAALLLNFDNISSIDISLLIEDFLRKNPGYEFSDVNSEYLNKYIKSENNKISLKNELNMDSYIPENTSNLQTRLQQIAGTHIRKYLKNFDMEEFMLRKIKYYSGIEVDSFDRLLCKKQQEELNKLDDKGYLTAYWKEDSIYDDYKVIDLSDYGRLRLFKLDYPIELQRFIEELKSLRYDTSILDDFLLKQDLQLPIWKILNTKNLEEFCNEYDRANLEPGVSKVCFKRLKMDEDGMLDENSKELIQNMLSIWDKDHFLYTCNPNDTFSGAKLLTEDVKEIKHVNWNEISVGNMLKSSGCKMFMTPNYKYAYECIEKDLKNQMLENSKEVIIKPSYLTVVERYYFDSENYFLVRGFIKADNKGYSIAFNPEYQKLVPKNIWEKSLRYSGNGIPEAYCLKRKQ